MLLRMFVVMGAFVGRELRCRPRVQDVGTSRRHAKLTKRDDDWWVEDLGSMNGIKVDGGVRTPNARLAPGMVIGVGPVRYRFQQGAGSEVVIAYRDRAAAATILTRAFDQGADEHLELLLQLAAALDSSRSMPDGSERDRSNGAASSQLLESTGKLILYLFKPQRALLVVGDQRWLYSSDHPGQPDTIDVSMSVLDRVQKRGDALLLSDPMDSGELGHAPSIKLLQIRSALGAPIIVDDEVGGFIYIDRRGAADARVGSPKRSGDGRYTEDDLTHLIGLCRLIGSLIASSRKLHELSTECERLRAQSGIEHMIVGRSEAMQALRDDIERRLGPVAPTS